MPEPGRRLARFAEPGSELGLADARFPDRQVRPGDPRTANPVAVAQEGPASGPLRAQAADGEQRIHEPPDVAFGLEPDPRGVPVGPARESPLRDAVVREGDVGQPAAGPSGSAADAGQPASADGTAEGGEADVGPGQEPDPAVTAETAQNVAAIAQAADEAAKALRAGDLDAALAALVAAREQATQGLRVIKAAASGRRAPATRPGALRDLVEDHLRTFPGTAFTPHQIGKALTRSAGAVANALDKLTALGTAQLACDKPRSYRLAPAPGDAGDPGTGAAAPPSAA